MCDYSLEAYKSRPAAAGERLTATRFPSGSVGFTGKPAETTENNGTTMTADDHCAVCVLPGATLLLEGLSDAVQKEFGVGSSERVTFIKLASGLYKDAVRFGDGKELVLQKLSGATAVVSPPIDLDKTLKLDQPLDTGLVDDSDQVRARQPDFVEGDD